MLAVRTRVGHSSRFSLITRNHNRLSCLDLRLCVRLSVCGNVQASTTSDLCRFQIKLRIQRATASYCRLGYCLPTRLKSRPCPHRSVPGTPMLGASSASLTAILDVRSLASILAACKPANASVKRCLTNSGATLMGCGTKEAGLDKESSLDVCASAFKSAYSP